MLRPTIRGIRLRLALALLFVVGLALAVVYLIVVPSLESELVGARLERLEADVRTLARGYENDVGAEQGYAEAGAAVLQERVVIYTELEDNLLVLGDSNTSSSVDVERDPFALRAAETGRLESGKIERRGREFAEAALPLREPGVVILVIAPTSDTLSSLHVIERKLIVAGLIGLAVALVMGYALASMHARRIRRLERAAERIARGRFDEPVADGGRDELGELARAFDTMRVRLEKLDRARSEFIANASHELRTPLFSLGGFLELLADEELDEATRAEFLETMREQVDRLAKLATDLLDLSRLDAGRMLVAHEPVDLGEVARVVAAEFSALAERRDHPVEVQVEGAPIARADELRVLQVARALLDNSIRHTPAGTRVSVRAFADREHAHLEVEDDGPGIPPEHAQHVFERFYRADGGVASGSGLGLAIARELVEMMDGEVVLSHQPEGTRIRVSLGAAPTSVPAPAADERVFT
jgi:signal transduction histidine kinase